MRDTRPRLERLVHTLPTSPPSRRGLVLVASVGILGVLSVMALAFASVMRLEARAARNFAYGVRAEFVARAGIEDAISRLRSLTRDGTELPYCDGRPAAWYTWRGTEGGGWKVSFPAHERDNYLDDDGDGLVDAADASEDEGSALPYSDWIGGTHVAGGDNYTLTVVDAASMINVNAGDNLGTILDNLCRVVGAPLVSADQAALVPEWFASRTPNYRTPYTSADHQSVSDLFYRLEPDDPATGRPLTTVEGRATYGDGFAIGNLVTASSTSLFPLDLNGNGNITDGVVTAANLELLPVVVIVRWRSLAGGLEGRVQLMTVIRKP